MNEWTASLLGEQNSTPVGVAQLHSFTTVFQETFQMLVGNFPFLYAIYYT